MANLSTNVLVELIVRMNVTPGAKSVSQLADDLVAAGYVSLMAETQESYNLKVVIPASCVVDTSIRSPSYFMWDFTDPTTLATNATVTGIGFDYRLPPPQGTVITVR